MIKQIYLDLDDVCNAFTMHALKHVGCPVESFDFQKYSPEWGFDIVKAANKLHPWRTGKQAFTPERFWGFIDRSVWMDTPESTEFKRLLSACEQLVGRENICILTTPTEDPDCLAGKLEWIHNHFPPWMHRQYLMGPQKRLLAKPEALLIDDSDANVNAFERAGGRTILVPRPWNSLHKVDTSAELNAAFTELFREKREESACYGTDY